MVVIPGLCALAAPSITSVSGETETGKTITLQGTGFGTKSPALPLVWADFEGGSISASVKGSGISFGANGCHITQSGQDTHSRFSVRDAPNSSQDGKSCGNVSVLGANATKIYAFMRRKFDHANFWKTFADKGYVNYKFFRAWPQSDPYPNQYLIYLSGSVSNPQPFDVSKSGVLATYSESSGSSQDCGFKDRMARGGSMPPVQTWIREEYELRHGVGNAVTRMWRNGRLDLNRTNGTSRGGSCSNATWNRIYLENFYSINAPIQDAYVYMDDVYVDKTWARVMLGNSPIFASCTHREPQIPTSWSESSIQVTVNLGTFEAGTKAYLFVVDANGNASPGKEINIGSADIVRSIPSSQKAQGVRLQNTASPLFVDVLGRLVPNSHSRLAGSIFFTNGHKSPKALRVE